MFWAITATSQAMVINYAWTDTLNFRIPFLPGTLEFVWQYIAIVGSAFFLIMAEFLLIYFGFYFWAILNIFLESIKNLNNDYVRSSRYHFRQYHKKHLDILLRLKHFDALLTTIQIIQMGTCLPMTIGTLYLIRLYPNWIVVYLMFIASITEIFEICFFGEVIHSKTEKIFTALYLTKWYEMSREDQMILLMMMRMTITPFSLKAAGMYNINMRAFLEIVKFCFSFCAILYAFT